TQVDPVVLPVVSSGARGLHRDIVAGGPADRGPQGQAPVRFGMMEVEEFARCLPVFDRTHDWGSSVSLNQKCASRRIRSVKNAVNLRANFGKAPAATVPTAGSPLLRKSCGFGRSRQSPTNDPVGRVARVRQAVAVREWR